MKKTISSLFIMSMAMFMLMACSNEATPSQGNETVESQAESNQSSEANETNIGPSAEESNMEAIPSDEWAILKNEPKLYEGRPLANMPVEVQAVERFSDRVVIEGSVYESGSGHYVKLVQLNSSETDIHVKDALYIDGIVRNDIDTKQSFPSAATKVELTNYQKVEFADLLDPVDYTREINLSLENNLFSATIHSVDVGEKYTRIYLTTSKTDDNFSDNIEAVIRTSEGEFYPSETSEASKITIKSYIHDEKRSVLVFDRVDVENGFTLELTGIPFRWTYEEEKEKLIFEVE